MHEDVSYLDINKVCRFENAFPLTALFSFLSVALCCFLFFFSLVRFLCSLFSLVSYLLVEQELEKVKELSDEKIQIATQTFDLVSINKDFKWR